MLIAFSHGPVDNTDLISKEYSWEQLAKRMESPKPGPKDGAYLLRGGVLLFPKRDNDNLLEAELLIIDGDGSFDPETGELFTGIDPDEPDPKRRVKSNCVPIEQARDALDRLGYRYIIHTTHTNRPGILNKWRAYIPAKMKNEDELVASVGFVMAQLRAEGCFVDQVKEMTTWAQAWYLPRSKPQYLSAYKCFVSLSGEDVDVPAAVALEKREQAAEEAIRAAKPEKPKVDDGDSIIKSFNKSAGLAWVRGTLDAMGYKFVFKKGDTYRYISPTSESGTPGAIVFKGAEGDWCCYSHHGAHDPLSHRLVDPFRLYAIANHGGDQSAAGRELRKELNRSNSTGAADPFEGIKVNAEDFNKAGGSAAGDRFQWITRDNGTAPVLNSNWLIKRVIPAEGLGVIFGRPGSGKTFSVMDVAMHIAAGMPWRGQKVRQAAVSYVSPEAGRLGMNRVIGWCSHYGIGWPEDFRLSPAAIDLCSGPADAQALINDVRKNQPNCRLVVIDTLNRALSGGDENDGQDMGKFVALCDQIAKDLACFVLVVHHSGKDATRGSRGHSSLLGAISAEYEVTREQGLPGSIRVTKMRDGEDGAEFGFTITSIPLGQDEDGEDVTTGISIEADPGEAAAGRQAQPQGKHQHTLADAFIQYVDDYGRPNPTGTGFPEPGIVKVVDVDRFIEFAMGKMTSGKPHERRKQLNTALDSLRDRGYFSINGGLLWRR
jgi:hypothetical protein